MYDYIMMTSSCRPCAPAGHVTLSVRKITLWGRLKTAGRIATTAKEHKVTDP